MELWAYPARMPITQENAASHLLLLERWLREQEQQQQQCRYGEDQRSTDGLGSGLLYCQAAIRKLVEYIQLNFLEGDEAPPDRKSVV